MLNWIRKILFRPVLWASNRFSSKPDRQRIYKALSALLDCIIKEEKKKKVPSFHSIAPVRNSSFFPTSIKARVMVPMIS